MRRIDGKFYIEGDRILNPAGVEIPTDEPLFLLRARDIHALKTLYCYDGFCYADDCTDYHKHGIDAAIEAFEEFQRQHPELMKQPGITRGM